MSTTGIIIGDVDWVVQPEYPQYKEDDSKRTITVKFVARRDQIAEKLPARGSTFYDERWPWLNAFTALTLTKRELKPHKSNILVDVTLEYTSPESSDYETSTGIMQTWEVDDREVSIPIEQHDNYKTIWNYRLIAKKGVTADLAGYADVKTTKFSDADAQSYKWLKYGNEVPDGWYEKVPALKPGVESFIFPLCEIVWTRKSTDVGNLETYAQITRGKIMKPYRTFSIGGEWLVVSATLRQEGKYWVMTVRYRNSEKYDTDIYD